MGKRAAPIRKRPAAKPNVIAVRPAAASSAPPADVPSVSTWAVPVFGSLEPNYADHFVALLCEHLHHLPANMVINMWAYCAGTVSESVAAEKIADAILTRLGKRVKINLHAACDSSKPCETMARSDRSAKHFSRDIFDRDFTAGTFHCDFCQHDELMPTDGVDIYVCCFPCSPWSALGKRLGFNQKASAVIWQAILTIRHMNPCFFLFRERAEY